VVLVLVGVVAVKKILYHPKALQATTMLKKAAS
jgi:hypothetical protein